MDKSIQDSQTIRILGEDVSRRIAAGEVIERPFSVVRELLDNAIDAGAAEISVYLKDGGMGSVRVTDSGRGMSPSDLKICYLAHATSKINDLNDLDTLRTLGFRGEALSSMAACARLEIVSALSAGAGQAHRLVVQGGKPLSFEPYRGTPGTAAEVSNLFFNMPARKKFLKRTSAETAMCKAVFLDKALPFPRITFRLYLDGLLKIFLENSSLKKRVTRAYAYAPHEDLFWETAAEAKGFSLKLVCAAPELYRKDRKHIQLFVNNRRIYEYSLVQAVEYGFGQYLPGGLFPVCFVFLEADPSLVDFNIHPAKKEVRLKNLPLIHQTLVTVIKEILGTARNTHGKQSFPQVSGAELPFAPHPPPEIMPSAALRHTANIVRGPQAPASTSPEAAPRYMGQLWNVFLVFALGDLVYFVDQHAAHERLLFEKLKLEAQNADELLFPICFEVEAEEGDVITKNSEELKKAGIVVEKLGRSSFELKTLPQSLQALPESEVIEFLKGFAGSRDDLIRELYARTACRLAVKEGQELDELTAIELMKGVLELENPRCPHGRPIYYSLNKSDLYKLTGRTL